MATVKPLALTLFATLLALPLGVQAQSRSDYAVTVERKKGSAKSVSEAGTWATSSWSAEITLQNRTMKPSPDLVMRYMIFKRMGSRVINGSNLQKIKGGAKVESIKGSGKVTLLTDDVPLEIRRTTGGRITNQDKVEGVWVRFFDAQGNMVADYANPSTLMQKYKWEN